MEAKSDSIPRFQVIIHKPTDMAAYCAQSDKSTDMAAYYAQSDKPTNIIVRLDYENTVEADDIKP